MLLMEWKEITKRFHKRRNYKLLFIVIKKIDFSSF